MTLADTQDNQKVDDAFKRQFKEICQDIVMCHKQLSFYRCASMYMDSRWEYDHKYFKWMIEQEQKVNSEAIGAVITKMHEAIQSYSSSKYGSMSCL